MREKIRTLDKLIHLLICRYYFEIGIGILFVFSVVIRVKCMDYASGDYNVYLSEWYRRYQEKGMAGLREPIGNYYVPYNIILAVLSYIPYNSLYLIKGVSYLFEYLSAIFIFLISRDVLTAKLRPGKADKMALLTTALFLFLPVVWMDSGGWVQCDIIYTFWGLWSIHACMRGKYTKAFILFSIGFCFKLQLIFLLPLFVIIYLRNRDFSIFNFAILPLTYIIAGIPAILYGRDWEVYGVYFNQMKEYSDMTMNFPNFAAVLPNESNIYGIITNMFCVFALFLTAYYIQKNRVELNHKNLLIISAWTGFTCVMFLSSMHERYGFMVLILITLYYLLYDRGKLWAAVILNVMFMIIYETHARVTGFTPDFDIHIYSYIHLAIYVFCSYDWITQLKPELEKRDELR